MWSYWPNQVFSGTLMYLQGQQKDKITDSAECVSPTHHNKDVAGAEAKAFG